MVTFFGGTVGACPTATTFLARTSGLDAAHTAAYQDLICGLVTDGIWTKLDVLHIYATQDTTTAQLNLVSASYPATLNGAPTFTADRGYTGTGGSNTKYIDTGFNPTTAPSPNFVQNSAHLSLWSLTSGTSNYADMGSHNVGTSTSYLLARYIDAFTYWRVNSGLVNDPSFVVGTGSGLFLGSRTNSTTIGCYQNGAIQTTASAVASTAPTNLNMYSLGWNANGTPTGSDRQQAMISIGSALDATQSTAFYNRLRTYMTAVGVP